MLDTATTLPWTATGMQARSDLTFRSIDSNGVAASDPCRTSTSVGWIAGRMLNDIYSRRILELAADIPLQGTLPDAHASAKAHSKLCGSTVTVHLKLDGNVVSAFAHEVKACALGQASSSIMGRYAVGSTIEELRTIREEVHQMLKAGGKPPSGKWADLALLEPARDLKARHASILLTFDAVVDAISKAEAAEKQQTAPST